MKKEFIILFGVFLLTFNGCSKITEQAKLIDREYYEQERPKSAEDISNETLNLICQQEEWPSDCSIIPSSSGRSICEKCKNIDINHGENAIIEEEIDKLIVANPLDLSQISRISKFRSCYGHDYSGLNIKGEKEYLRSMKHYIEFSPQFLGYENAVKVFSPFDGKVVEIIDSGGKQIFISANGARNWNFIFFHINTAANIEVGTDVKAGQLIGYVYVREWPNFDFALKHFIRSGEIFDSPFLHMQDSIIKEYELHGVTKENIIISKEIRDKNACPINGIRDGEEAFTGETEKEDFVVLK